MKRKTEPSFRKNSGIDSTEGAARITVIPRLKQCRRSCRSLCEKETIVPPFAEVVHVVDTQHAETRRRFKNVEGIGVGEVGCGDDETGVLLETNVQFVAEETQNARLATSGASHNKQTANVDEGSVGGVVIQRELKSI